MMIEDSIAFFQETRNISNSRGSAHLVWRCGNCKKESSASFVAEPSKPYSSESNGQFATLLKMECRGLEFTDFAPVCIFSIVFSNLIT
jgi:hypothetical protein